VSNNLTLLTGLALLKAQKATRVVVEYSGSGDSGSIDSIRATTARGKEITIPEQLEKLIDQWSWDKVIPNTGWWNNDGGFGTVTIDLKTYEAVCEHSDRTGDTESTTPRLTIQRQDPIRKVLAGFRNGGVKTVSVSYNQTDAEWSFTEPAGMKLPEADEQTLKEWVWEHVHDFAWPSEEGIEGRTADVFGTVTFDLSAANRIAVTVEHCVTHYKTDPHTQTAVVE